MTENVPTQAAPETDRANRRDNMAWIGGAVLILIGVLFLLQNFSALRLDNWWALFILIPAAGSLASAWRLYQTHGRWSAAARGPLFGGLILLIVTAIFLFGLDFGRLWPVLLILAGIGALLNALIKD